MRGIPTKQQVVGVLVNLVNSGKLASLEVIRYETSGCLSSTAEDVVREHFPDWLPPKIEPAVPASPGSRAKIIDAIINLCSQGLLDQLDIIRFESQGILTEDTCRVLNKHYPGLNLISDGPISFAVEPPPEVSKAAVPKRDDADWNF